MKGRRQGAPSFLMEAVPSLLTVRGTRLPARAMKATATGSPLRPEALETRHCRSGVLRLPHGLPRGLGSPCFSAPAGRRLSRAVHVLPQAWQGLAMNHARLCIPEAWRHAGIILMQSPRRQAPPGQGVAAGMNPGVIALDPFTGGRATARTCPRL